MNPLFGFGETLFSPTHIILLLVVGVLLFGRRLPEVGRYLGKGIVEFKKGIKGLEDDVETTAPQVKYEQPVEAPRPPQRVVATTPKFEDAPSAPTAPPKV